MWSFPKNNNSFKLLYKQFYLMLLSSRDVCVLYRITGQDMAMMCLLSVSQWDAHLCIMYIVNLHGGPTVLIFGMTVFLVYIKINTI